VRILIADDEVHVCNDLEYIVTKHIPQADISICFNGTEVIKSLSSFIPDLVFLDIEMPGLNGMEIGGLFKNIKTLPHLVYVTAYEQFAVEAVNIGAKGYVLKPFYDSEIIAHLDKALHDLQKKGAQTAPTVPQEERSHIVASLGSHKYVLRVQDIVAISSIKRQVFVHTDDKDYTYQESLSTLESVFSPKQFFRCHRSYLVNIGWVREIKAWSNGTYVLVLSDRRKTEIPVSRNYVESFRKAFGMR